jgi:polyisoprenoid-binding protein YceI
MNRFLLLFTLCALSAKAADQTLVLAPANTKITWSLSSSLHTVHGTFRLKSGSVTFNTESGKASGSVVVDVKSGESGNGSRDSRMQELVLESPKYPDAVFTPDRVEGKLPNLSLHGNLRMHGADHQITMNVQATEVTARPEADISFEIPFIAWGMKDPGNFLLKVSKTVQVHIHLSSSPN